MLVRYLMERTDDRTLEQAKRAFNAVRVNVAAHVFALGVRHGFVSGVGIIATPIGWPFVGHDACWIWRNLFDETVKCLSVSTLAGANTNMAFALKRGDHHRF